MPGNKKRFNGRKTAYAGLLLLGGFVVGGCGEPGASGDLTQTPVPTVTMAPQPTYTTKPTATESPELPTVTPFMPPTAEPTMTTAPTEEPTMVPTVTPTVPPTATPTVPPTEAVTPSAIPTVTPSPEPTDAVTPIPTPEPTEMATPSPEPTMVPTPVPTAYPEYDTLIRNGWQRTEDFFGIREVYFSGMFDTVELLAVTGRYEYRYTASTDSVIAFSLIGEEGADVYSFVEELTMLYPECLVTAEGDADYSYRYDTEGQTVSGRIYDCTRDGQKNCMRTELRYPAENENYGNEGYGFYLK